MADFIQNITNTVRVFGVEQATKWGDSAGVGQTMVWGTSLWGYGYTTLFDLRKLIAESVESTSTINLDYRKIIANEFIVVANEDLTRETLSNGIWNYVFVADTTNAEERDPTNYASLSAGTVSYVCAAAGSVVWT